MKSVQELTSLADLIINHGLPREQILFMSEDEYNSTRGFLRIKIDDDALGLSLPGSDPAIKCALFRYGGVKFYIVKY